MPWNTLATADIEAEILPDEVTALQTIAGSSTILATILTTVLAELQAQILVGGNQIGAAGTIPDQIRGDAIAIAAGVGSLHFPIPAFRANPAKPSTTPPKPTSPASATAKKKSKSPHRPKTSPVPATALKSCATGPAPAPNPFAAWVKPKKPMPGFNAIISGQAARLLPQMSS